MARHDPPKSERPPLEYESRDITGGARRTPYHVGARVCASLSLALTAAGVALAWLVELDVIQPAPLTSADAAHFTDLISGAFLLAAFTGLLALLLAPGSLVGPHRRSGVVSLLMLAVAALLRLFAAP